MMQTRKGAVAAAKGASRSMSYLSVKEVFPIEAHHAHAAGPLSVNTGDVDGIKYCAVQNGANSANLNFAIRAGSQFESPIQKGSAQLLATAAFNGTRNRSGLALCRYLNDIGATFGSSADRETVRYNVTVPAGEVDKAFSAIASAIISAPVDGYVIDELKPTAELQYHALASSPRLQLEELIHEAAYGEDSPLGSSFFASNLHDIHGADVLEFRKNQFLAGNVSVTARGVSEEDLKKNISQFFRALPQGSTDFQKNAFVGGYAKVKSDFEGYTGAAIAFPIASGDKGAAAVAAQAVEAKVAALGLTGSVAPFYKKYLNGGIFGYYFLGEVEEVNKNIKAVSEQFKNVAGGFESAKVQVALRAHEALQACNGSNTLYTLANLNLPLSALDTRTASDSSISAALADSLKAGPAFAVIGRKAGVLSHSAVGALFK